MQLIYPLENQTRFEVIERDSARLPDSLLVSNQSFGRFCRRVYPPGSSRSAGVRRQTNGPILDIWWLFTIP